MTYVGLKGGSPSSNHGQMNTGSFALDAEGVRWAVDPGAKGCHEIESRGMDLWNRAQDSDGIARSFELPCLSEH